VGIYDPSSGLFSLRNSASEGNPDLTTTIANGMRGRTVIVWTP